MVRLAFAALVVAFTFAAVPAHAQGVPGTDKNKCLAGKIKCVSDKVKGLLKCREKCVKNPKNCGPAQTDCEDKVRFKFERPDDPPKGCFAKLEAKQNPAKPETICATTGDTATVEAEADVLVAALLATLEPCVGAGGVQVGGACWFLGAAGANCDATCAAAGLVYDPATASVAGSGGSFANCQAVLDALGRTAPPDSSLGDTGCPAAVGCSVELNQPDASDHRRRCTSPATTSSASQANAIRACACMP